MSEITMFECKAEDCKKGDITRLKNLIFKLKVKVTKVDTNNTKEITGRHADMIICDEVGWKK